MTQLTVISRDHFANKTWQRPSSYAFAAQTNIVPVTVAELAKLVPNLPLGFIKTDATFQLVAITSLQPGINLLVDPEGNWIGDYVPAALRAYPFQLVKPQDSEDSVLCFDTSSGLLLDTGSGEDFFDVDGASPAIKEALDFLAATEKSREFTQQVVDTLQTADLIQPWPLSIQQGEQTVSVEGLYRVDEVALNAMADEAFHALRKAGALALIYGQLFSMNQLSMLQKAEKVQAGIREQLVARPVSLTENIDDFSFRFSEGETIKFS